MCVWACGNSQQEYALQLQRQRTETNRMWQSSAAGMLDSSELKTFKGLHFFDVDPSYRCDARIMWYPQTAFFDMPHTDGVFRPYMKVGEVHLKVKDKAITLYAYQTEKMRLQRTLFIPFSDQTNGQSSYGGGRYLDVPYAPQSSNCVVDFNTAYAPYCAHSTRYSCPVVPGENQLEIAIEAGEKK
jgi:uncharacterized protein (DUF1684 family)